MASRGLLCDAALLFNASHAWDERVFVSTQPADVAGASRNTAKVDSKIAVTSGKEVIEFGRS